MIKLEKTTAYTVDEVAEILHQCNDTVRRYIRTGKIKAKKIGRAYYITDTALEKFVSADDTTERE